MPHQRAWRRHHPETHDSQHMLMAQDNRSTKETNPQPRAPSNQLRLACGGQGIGVTGKVHISHSLSHQTRHPQATRRSLGFLLQKRIGSRCHLHRAVGMQSAEQPCRVLKALSTKLGAAETPADPLFFIFKFLRVCVRALGSYGLYTWRPDVDN